MFQHLRDEVLDGVARIGGRLRELRLDTELDISHGVVRYLELLKLAALLQRPDGQSLEDALADVNARLLAAATPLQREILLTSTLDDTLTGRGRRTARRTRRLASALAPTPSRPASSTRSGRSCRAAGSASRCPPPISTPTAAARCATSSPASCASPPSRPSTSASASSCTRCSSATTPTAAARSRRCSSCSTAAGGGAGSARASTIASCSTRHARADALPRAARPRKSSPSGSSAQFDFRLGPHHLRGRVDRVDRVGEEEYELIDYKTSRPKTAEQLREDIQLSLYALAAREDWGWSPRGRPTTTCSTTSCARRSGRARRRGGRGDCAGGGGGDPRAGVRADAIACGLLDL